MSGGGFLTESEATMNLAHLYYFRKLVEVRNYSRAAKELFIAQPTLSLAVSNLEKELGVALIKKKRNTLELTIDGEDLYEAVVVATNALDHAVSLIRERASLEFGVMTVGTVYSIQSQAWSEAIRDYREHSHSKVQFKWKQGTTESLMHELKNGSVDVIFAGVLGKGDSDVASIPCFTQRVALVVNRSHPLAGRAEISLNELRGIKLITYRNTAGPFAVEVNALLSKGSGLNVSCEYSDEITLCSLVTADPDVMAIACHSWLLDAFPDIVPIPVKEAPTDFHTFYLSYRKRERLPFAVEEFVSFMKGYECKNASPRSGGGDMMISPR